MEPGKLLHGAQRCCATAHRGSPFLPRARQPLSLSALSSRERMLSRQPRCFAQAVVCNMVGIYFGSRKHGTWELRPKFAGRRVSKCTAWWLLGAGEVLEGASLHPREDALLHCCQPG